MYYIDLFSGIGGFHLGLLQAGFKFEKCYHSEINKYAKSVYQKQFSDSEDIGDVTRINVPGLPRGKYIVSAGWPCQDNSIAGKRQGQSRGLRSGLFSEVVRILSALIQMGSEVIFIGENVKGLYSVNEGVDFHDTIARLTCLDTDMPQLTLEIQLCNTRWYLPQNRERIYFVGYTGSGSGRKIFPIGESQKSNEKIELRKTENIAGCIGVKNNSPQWQFDASTTLIMCDSGQGRKIQNRNNVAPLRANTGVGHNNLVEVKPVLIPDRKQKRQHGRRKKNHNEPMFTLTKQDIHGIEIIKPKLYTMGNTKPGRKCLGASRVPEVGNKERSIRRLTPIECARLQGFPDDWTKTGIIFNTPEYIAKCAAKGQVTEEYVVQMISDTQQYKMIGNSVSVPVVKTIASRIKEVFINDSNKEINI